MHLMSLINFKVYSENMFARHHGVILYSLLRGASGIQFQRLFFQVSRCVFDFKSFKSGLESRNAINIQYCFIHSVAVSLKSRKSGDVTQQLKNLLMQVFRVV